MGVTIESKNHSIDMGYGGFNRIRNKVAKLTGKEIGEHYTNLDKAIILNGSERKNFFDEYDNKIIELAKEFKIPNGIIEFLYSSDCSGKLSSSKCKQIYKVIENYDDDILYGYCGRKDCAMFKDFKEILKDCIDNKYSMKWF